MRKLRLYQVDAFTDHLFGGNPAAVCLLDTWLDDATLQAIAEENNLSETAFLVREQEMYRIRWFTPAVEIDLCGHATLAAAFVVFQFVEPRIDKVVFGSASGPLMVTRDDELLRMDFPVLNPESCSPPQALFEAVGGYPAQVLEARDYMLVFANADDVVSLAPDMQLLASLQRHVIVTAPGSDVDFVSRFFAPCAGIAEDPVTGSAHCTLIPYWAKRLGKNKLHARQVSKRGGELACELHGDRVILAGQAVLYLEGTICL